MTSDVTMLNGQQKTTSFMLSLFRFVIGLLTHVVAKVTLSLNKFKEKNQCENVHGFMIAFLEPTVSDSAVQMVIDVLI